MEDGMNEWSGIEFTIGLRHVLEDAIQYLGDGAVEPARQKLVLRDLSDFMERARTGSEVTAAATFTANADDASAVEAYALLFHHLNASLEQELAGKIRSTADIISQLSNGSAVSPEKKLIAKEFIGTLLANLDYEKMLSYYQPLENFG
jgi:hypothetical protein